MASGVGKGREEAGRGGKGSVRDGRESRKYRPLPTRTDSFRPVGWEVSGAHPLFIDHPVKSIINSPESTGMGFWSINPYVGCQFGCSYCYARYTHRYTAERALGTVRSPVQAAEAFERQIFVKQHQTVLAALEHDIPRVYARVRSGNGCPIVIGTATDPYQPAERRFHVTRTVLERLLDAAGLSIAVITKSPLVCRDIDLLTRLARKHSVTVFISLISTKVRIIKLFEARSSMPHARFRALQKLREAGIEAGINAAPVLPGITDSIFQIDALVAAAREANAAFVSPSVVRLCPSARESFLPVVKQHFPDLMPRYRAAYRGGWNASAGYVAAIERRFERVARKHGILGSDPLHVEQERPVELSAQLSLL